MAKQIFSRSVINQTARRSDIDITKAVRNSRDTRKEINRIFQQANRRMQNIEKAGLASPAAKAVIAERGKRGFTYFTMAGLDPLKDSDWAKIEYEFGRAKAFLANPTSTASGARQYIKFQADRLNGIPFEAANKIVDISTSPTVSEYGEVNILSYGSIIDEYRDALMQIGDEMKMSAEDMAKSIEEVLKDAQDKVIKSREYLTYLDRFV